MPGEPGGPGLLDSLASAVPRLLLPVLLPDRDLDWAVYEGPQSLDLGGAAAPGMRQPRGPRLGVAAVASAGLLLVPALAVDQRGVRLGRGGGSYDRALARVGPAALVVALLYDGEIRQDLPREPHDRPVHGVLTPGGYRSFPV